MKPTTIKREKCERCGIEGTYIEKDGDSTKCLWCDQGYGGKAKSVKPTNYAMGKVYIE